MERSEIAAALDRAEIALDRKESLAGTRFWKAVAALKDQPHLVPEFSDRVADIDRRAFEAWALLRVPIGVGTGLAVAATAAGLAGIAAAYYLAEPWNWLVFGGGTAVLLVTTHGLGHLVVGRALGMRFTHWFVGTITRPQPGVKVDYSSYLATDARRRAWMHASGAIVTKAVPFLLIPAATAAGLPAWVGWALAALGVATIVTDVLWSTKTSDWKKFRREMGYAR